MKSGNVQHFSYFLYRPENLSLTLMAERRPRVVENRVLREILVPEREEVTG